MKRRKFIHNTSLSLLGSGLAFSGSVQSLAATHRRPRVDDAIHVGLIGCKGMGWSNLTSMLKIPGVHCKALCDIDQGVLEQRKKDLQGLKMNPDLYEDYREMLKDKDIDVVIVATPDHWHCLQMIDACAAGKDVYVEKPVANSIAEARLMVEAAKQTRRIVQVNQWQRSQDHFTSAVNFVKSGKLGKISSTKTWMYRGGTNPLPPVPDSRVPKGVNYELWLGPAEKREFNKNRFHYEFRWFWDYAGGLMTDWGVHLVDMILMAMNATEPVSVVSSGGKFVFPDDARETPDIQTVVFDYSGFQLTWEHNMATSVGYNDMSHGISFIGENGTLFLNRSGWQVKPHTVKESTKMDAVQWQERSDNGLDKHTVNFIEAFRARKPELLNCPIEAGSRVAINCHMGNIAFRTGEKIEWDGNRGKFDSARANRLITPDYDNGWKLPKV
jgi:predicted dehydrogenase